MLDVVSALAGSLVTAVAGWLGRSFVLASCCCSPDALMAALTSKGVDLENGAMERYADNTYRKVAKLGSGTSGTVFRVTTKEKKVYAMKVMKKDEDINEKEALETEVKCLNRLRHKNIVNMIETFQSQTTVWIVMEIADGGELYARIIKLDHFSEQVSCRFIKEVLKAVHYVHSNGIVHRDLKPENILLDSPGDDAHTKVADFGLAVDMGIEGFHPEQSMRLKKSKKVQGGFCGSPICMAPEVARKEAEYGPQCDVWSIGCITHELLSGKPAFQAKSAKELFRIIKKGEPPAFAQPVWGTISKEAKNLVASMLLKAPEERPSAAEALQHDWFEKATDHYLEDVHSEHKVRQSERVSRELDQDALGLEETLQGHHHAVAKGHVDI